MNIKKEMIKWIVENTNKSIDEVTGMFEKEKELIDSLFEDYPDVMFSEDPVKWAELLAVSVGFLKEEPLEFMNE